MVTCESEKPVMLFNLAVTKGAYVGAAYPRLAEKSPKAMAFPSTMFWTVGSEMLGLGLTVTLFVAMLAPSETVKTTVVFTDGAGIEYWAEDWKPVAAQL